MDMIQELLDIYCATTPKNVDTDIYKEVVVQAVYNELTLFDGQYLKKYLHEKVEKTLDNAK